MMRRGGSGCFEGYSGFFFWSADFRLIKMNPELLAFPSSLMGGRPRPRRLFADPFSSPVPSWGNVPEADSEAVPMAPLRRRCSCFFDDGPRSGIREGDLAYMWRKYAKYPLSSVSVLSTYSPHLEDFNGYPSTRGTSLIFRRVKKPSRGIWGNYPFGNDWSNQYVFVKIQEPVGYPTSWRTIDVSRPVSFAGEAVARLIMGIPRRFRWVTFLVSKKALRQSRVWGNTVKLPVSAIYDEHQKAKTRKRRPLYTPPPRLARAASLVNGSSSTSSTGAEAVSNHDPLVDAHRRLIGEVFFLRNQVQNMMARRDLLIQQVKASARWELMKEWLEKRLEHWDPEEEYRRHLFMSGGADQQAGRFYWVATPRSVVGSRFSEDPSF
ncbi:hypothetical protein DY000_02007494 [Brassica cretica]|uniref:Uncharacterized protein n=1 Tax=Brassica cretica TaxID=69181 RepID=A0ABQ7CG40_BRACR|nr:hypothetical protein DY000_02007494 [Brassica cretica]